VTMIVSIASNIDMLVIENNQDIYNNISGIS